MASDQNGSKNPFSSGYTGSSKPSLHVAKNPSQCLNIAQAGPVHRKPGEEDEAGNKIPHTGSLSRLLHGEHVAHNVDQEGSGTHTKAKRVDEHK